MNATQRAAFKDEIAQARCHMGNGAVEAGFAHLERAHVIGQASVVAHVTSHWWMCVAEWRRGRPAAVLGQVLRIVLGALGSALGIIPVGNTGGTDISMFKRMPVADDIQKIIGVRTVKKPTQPRA